jgi:hypothetical protein
MARVSNHRRVPLSIVRCQITIRMVVMLIYADRSRRFRKIYTIFTLTLLSFIAISGCSAYKKTREMDLKAIKGIAFLIIESNYEYPENENAIKEGIKYSRHWLSKQTPGEKKKLEELSYAMSSLIINLNIEYLEKMTGQSENIDGKLNEIKKQQLEASLGEEEAFDSEWQEHKHKLNEEMLNGISEFYEKLDTVEDKVQVRLKVREVYTLSQPILRQAMENRIREIFRN